MKDYYNLLGIDPALKGAELESKLAAMKKEASRRATQASSIAKRLEAQQRLQLLEEAAEELLREKGSAGTAEGTSKGKSSSIIYRARHNIAPPKPVQAERSKVAMPLRKAEEERIKEIIDQSRRQAPVENSVQLTVQAPVEEVKAGSLFRKAEAPAFHNAYAEIWKAIWGGIGILVLLAVLTPVFYKDAAAITDMVFQQLVQYKYLIYAAFLGSNIFCWTRLSDTGMNAPAASAAMGISGFLCSFMLLYPIHQSLAVFYGSSVFWNLTVLVVLWTCVLTAAGIGAAVARHSPTGFFALVYIALYEAAHYCISIRLGNEAAFAVQLLAYAAPIFVINIFDSLLMQASPFNYTGGGVGSVGINRWVFGASRLFFKMPSFAIAVIIIARFIINGMFELVSREYNAYVRLVQLAPAYKAGILAVFLLLAAVNFRYKIPNALKKLYQLVFVSSGAAVHYLALAGLYFYTYRYYLGGLFNVSLYMLVSFCILVLPAVLVSILMSVKENTIYMLAYLAGFMGIKQVLFVLKDMPASGYLYFVALIIPVFPARLASKLLKGKAAAGMATDKKRQRAEC